MTRHLTACAILTVLASCFAAPSVRAQDVVEPGSGVAFAPSVDGMSLLGVALRTKTFLHVKVYAAGFYVADAALAGPLAAHKGKLGTPAFYRDLVSGDFEKQLTMKFVRDLTASQIQGAFRETLEGADPKRVDAFVGFFSDLKSGSEATLRWKDGNLETTVAGQAKAPIPDAAFAARVYGIWLGEHPIQDDIKKNLVARAGSLLK